MAAQSWDASGYKDKQDHIRGLKIEPELDVIENVFDDKEYTVKLVTTEFSTVCPKTGLPDFATLEIEYVPGKWLVEEKALKLYLTSYRNLGIFQEHATNKVLEDFARVVKPKRAKVTAKWNNRGGIAVEVVAEYRK